jgi:hypothetical protein
MALPSSHGSFFPILRPIRGFLRISNFLRSLTQQRLNQSVSSLLLSVTPRVHFKAALSLSPHLLLLV